MIKNIRVKAHTEGSIEEINTGARNRIRETGGVVPMMYRFTRTHP